MKLAFPTLFALTVGATCCYAGPDIRWYKSGACEVVFEDGSKTGGTETNEHGDPCCMISHGIDNNICYTEFEFIGPRTHESASMLEVE